MMSTMFEQTMLGIIQLSVSSVFVAVCIDFMIYNKKETIKKSKKSIVATGTMTGFFIFYYLILRFDIGIIKTNNYIAIVIGTVFIVAGAVINIIGRLRLKENWSNHIKIYREHTLVNSGIYRIIRHPLYASIMLMFFGGSLAYRNYLSFALTVVVFIPFMYYRAKQEENLLIKEFPEYEQYKKEVGMFFPKIWRV